MMDELRDYRFYNEDMIHPSGLAIEYIWNRFATTWIAESAYPTMKKVEEINKGMQHRPFNPNTEQHQTFLTKLEDKKQSLLHAFPFMQF